jgi:hypothetical protein
VLFRKYLTVALVAGHHLRLTFLPFGMLSRRLRLVRLSFLLLEAAIVDVTHLFIALRFPRPSGGSMQLEGQRLQPIRYDCGYWVDIYLGRPSIANQQHIALFASVTANPKCQRKLRHH